jgi:hypothetical protein
MSAPSRAPAPACGSSDGLCIRDAMLLGMYDCSYSDMGSGLVRGVCLSGDSGSGMREGVISRSNGDRLERVALSLR